MPQFFISYRRDDAEADAGRIADRLRAEVGDDDVFFDTLAIEGGDRWMERIDQALSTAQVMLVIMGRTWLTLSGPDGQPRLWASDDVVAYEIANALQRGIRVIPVRVQGTALPRADALPATLRTLVAFNDHEVRSGTAFERDVTALIDVACGRRRGWRRWVPRSPAGMAAAGACAMGAIGLVAATVALQDPPTPAPSPPPSSAASSPARPNPTEAALPTAFDLQLEVTLRDTPGDDRTQPEMKLWHRRPNPNRATNINLLDEARVVTRGVLDYASPIPSMPAQGEEYEGLMHRLTLSGQANAEPTRICFTADLQPAAAGAKKDALVKLSCTEGQTCRIGEGDPGWARPCAAASAPHAAWTLLPAAHAEPAPISHWAVPSLATLQQPSNAGHAYSEVRLQSGPLPSLAAADRYTYALSMNGQPLYIDGLPPDAYPRRFEAAQGLDLRVGLENLNASGRQGGYEDLRIELSFFAGDRLVRQLPLQLRYVALRQIDGPREVGEGDLRVQWSAVYHPGRVEDAFQIFVTSAPDGAGLQAQKKRIDAAGLMATIGGRPQPIVAVLRPPFESNRNYGLNIGLRRPNGQIQFTFDEATSAALCGTLNALAQQRPQLVRRDSYRRTLDGKRGYEQCARVAAR